MKEKKQIERLFQEAFKDFEATPDEKNWEAIQNKMSKESNDKKPIPLWLRYASIAAILLLFFTVGQFVLDSGNTPLTDDPISDTKQDISTENPSQSKEGIANSDEESQDINHQSSVDTTQLEDSQMVNTNDNPESPNSQKTNTGVASTEAQGANASDIKDGKSSVSGSSNKKSGNNPVANSDYNNSLASNPAESKENAPTTTNPINPDGNLNGVDQFVKKQKDQVAMNSNSMENNKASLEEKQNNPNLSSTQDPASLNNQEQLVNGNILDENNKGEAPDEALAALAEETPKDSLTIEEAIAKAEEEDITEKEKLVNRWQVYANIAPVYYNTLGEGSHIDEEFVHNPKNGEVNTSYGINVGYALNDKFTLRTGVNSLKLSYDTANVILFESPNNTPNPQTNPLRNITLFNSGNNGQPTISALSADNLTSQQISSVFDLDAAISQRISYYEVPLEVEYNLIDRKFNFQVIGGFSTFFLDDNEVYSEVDGRKNYIGEANNINNVSFSANLGLGLNYKFSETFKFNFEPVFKYQLNAYENTAGDFRPYILGVYTGFSYKF